MSQPAKTRSFRSPSGTNFLICGDFPSVRFPRRMVPSCVSEPTGCDSPLRTSSTPAMNVVLTAPIPGNKIPSFPLAGSIFRGLSITLLQRRSVHAGLSIQAYQCRPIDAANPGVHDGVSTALQTTTQDRSNSTQTNQ